MLYGWTSGAWFSDTLTLQNETNILFDIAKTFNPAGPAQETLLDAQGKPTGVVRFWYTFVWYLEQRPRDYFNNELNRFAWVMRHFEDH